MEVSHGNKLNFKHGQTMKKIFILMAAAAVMFAASCNKMEEVNTPVEPVVETELITIDLNPMTKTSLDDKATVWTEGDEVSVTVGGKNIGSLKLVKGTTSTFSGEVYAGYNGDATLNYPAGVTSVPTTQAAVAGSFANGAALLEGTTTMDALRAGEGAQLSNTTALLQFSVAQAGDVTFEVGTTKYTVTGCQTGKTYYACVAPSANVSFTARIGGYLSKKASKNVTFAANKISDLGALPAPTASDVTLQGINGNWSSNVTMYNDIYWSVALNVKSSSAEFKFTKGSEWIGAKSSFVHKDVYAYPVGGDNIKFTANTAYDIYYNHDGGLYMVLPAGTDINQDIYVATDMFIRGNYTNYTGYGNWGKGRTPVVAQGKYYCFKNYVFTSVPEFKFTTSEEGWNWQYSSESTLKLNTWTTLKSGSSLGSNTKYGSAGTYDIYTTSDKNNRNKVLIVATGTAPAAL